MGAVTIARLVLELCVEEKTASRYEGWLQIYWISNCKQLKRGGHSAWGLGEGLTKNKHVTK